LQYEPALPSQGAAPPQPLKHHEMMTRKSGRAKKRRLTGSPKKASTSAVVLYLRLLNPVANWVTPKNGISLLCIALCDVVVVEQQAATRV
jgi:hypothetical protein